MSPKVIEAVAEWSERWFIVLAVGGKALRKTVAAN
jgi:hypothetical protein